MFQEKGFTLVEIMVAITILTVGLVVVLQVFPLGFNVEKSNQMETEATWLCQEKIEEIMSKNYQDIAVGTTTEASLPAPFEKFKRETAVVYVDGTLQESVSDTGLKKLRVIVSWKSPLGFGDKDKNVKLVTLIAEK